MNTKDNHKNKPTDTPKTKVSQDEQIPAKKVKRQATQKQLEHPLHGVKLTYILENLVEYYGWTYLANEVNIMCFKRNPTIKVSIKFLRKMSWAREHVEDIYMDMIQEETYQRLVEKKKSNSQT